MNLPLLTRHTTTPEVILHHHLQSLRTTGPEWVCVIIFIDPFDSILPVLQFPANRLRVIPMKVPSPQIWLNSELLQQATIEGARHDRSTKEQIEYWVSLGKASDGVLSIEEAIGIRSGLLQLRGTLGPSVDSEDDGTKY